MRRCATHDTIGNKLKEKRRASHLTFTTLETSKAIGSPQTKKPKPSQNTSKLNNGNNKITTPIEPDRAKLIEEDLGIDISEIKEVEVDIAIGKLKHFKTPGPDEATNELFKWLDLDNRNTLTLCLNEIWKQKKAPRNFNKAFVASIYKKR